MAKFKVGDRVLWVFGKDSDTGTIIKKNCEHSSLWLIRWDSNDRVLLASEENLSLQEERNTPWYETEEGKQWLSEQMDVEEAFNKSQEKKEEKTYHTGQRFLVTLSSGAVEWYCLLAQVESNVVCLIDFESGNRVNEPIYVIDSRKIAEAEMKMIAGDCTLHLL